MDRINFGEWLRSEREKRGWSQSDLARFSGLHRQIINKTENAVSEPALKTYIALSNALNISLVSILRTAGELPQGPDNQVGYEDWKFLLDQIPPDEQEELRQIALVKIEKRKKAEATRSANFKPEAQRK